MKGLADNVCLVVLAAVVAGLTQLRSPHLLDLAATVAVQGLPAIGLALLLGLAGQISIGHAAFYGLGQDRLARQPGAAT